MSNINDLSELNWAQSCDDMLLDIGISASIRSRLRQLAIKAMYIPLVFSQAVKHQNTPHLRIIFYHSIFEHERFKFSEQLKFFRDNYTVMPLGDALIKAKNNQITEPTLSITFDDGYLNNFTVAADILADQDLTACFYVTSGFIDIEPTNLSDIRNFCKSRFLIRKPIQNMTWDNIRTLRQSGHEIGSHGISHRSLTAISEADMVAEIQTSKTIIEGHLKEPVRHFSIPFGTHTHYSPDILNAISQTGYESCVLGIRGAMRPALNPYKLRRDHCSANWSIGEIRSHLMRSFLWPKQI